MSGNAVIEITHEEIVPTQSQDNTLVCSMSKPDLLKYQSAWDSGQCCGLSLKIGGQDYIIVKRSLVGDDACGGSETLDTPCIGKFHNTVGHVAIAWPSFDGVTFIPVMMDNISFRYDSELSEEIGRKIVNHEYSLPKGTPNGARFLGFQLSNILFPLT